MKRINNNKNVKPKKKNIKKNKTKQKQQQKQKQGLSGLKNKNISRPITYNEIVNKIEIIKKICFFFNIILKRTQRKKIHIGFQLSI